MIGQTIGKKENFLWFKIAIALKYASIILLLKVLPIQNIQAQNPIPEKFHIHLNQPLYLSGETIWYKIYTTNFQDHANHSKIAYINIHDKTGVLLLQQKLELSEGMANGSLKIPLIWQEDCYYFTCFTKWNLQFDSNGLAVKKIPVFNPFNSQGNFSTDSSGPLINEMDGNSEGKTLSIELDKESYSRRDEVQLNIMTSHGIKGNFSVTVHALYNIMDNPANNFVKIKYEIEPQTEKENSLVVEGLAIDPTTGSPISSDVFSLYKVGSNKFYKTSGSNGVIQIKMDEIKKASTFQLFNMNPYQSSIPVFTLKINGKELLGINSENQELHRNKEISKFLRNVQLNQKVIEIFSNQKTDSLQRKVFMPISLKADKVYDMEKYQLMKTFKEFLKEIVIYTDLHNENDKTTVRLKNTETRRLFMEKPWYLVDGYLTRDEKAVLDIPFKNLVRVEIFNTNKSILGQLETVMIRSGLIAIYTDNNYLKNEIEKNENIFEFEGITPTQEFFQDFQFSNSASHHNPKFAYQLYWNPNVENNQTINFLTSDFIGEYTIYVEGLDENGQLLSATKKFTVNY